MRGKRLLFAILPFTHAATAAASTTGYKDYADNYIIGFLAVCGAIILAQFLTALREPRQNIKPAQQQVDEAEKAHTLE